MPSHKAKRNEIIHHLATGVLHSYEMLINAHMDRLEQIAAEVQLNSIDEIERFTAVVTELEASTRSLRTEFVGMAQALEDVLSRIRALEHDRAVGREGT